MLKQELIANNPLRILRAGDDQSVAGQRLGLVMAPPGAGKTATLVQIALDNILRGNQVVHVSIGQTLDKTRTWYDDIFRDIVAYNQLENADEIREEIGRRRLIMTFNASTFSPPKLEERLNDLVYQNIFRPYCLIIDGVDLGNTDRGLLLDLRELMVAMNFDIWMSAVTHREDTRVSAEGVPAPCHEMADLFDTVILIQPASGKESAVLNIIKNGAGAGRTLPLNTSTMMIGER
jgi:hypothetical protein